MNGKLQLLQKEWCISFCEGLDACMALRLQNVRFLGYLSAWDRDDEEADEYDKMTEQQKLDVEKRFHRMLMINKVTSMMIEAEADEQRSMAKQAFKEICLKSDEERKSNFSCIVGSNGERPKCKNCNRLVHTSYKNGSCWLLKSQTVMYGFCCGGCMEGTGCGPACQNHMANTSATKHCGKKQHGKKQLVVLPVEKPVVVLSVVVLPVEKPIVVLPVEKPVVLPDEQLVFQLQNCQLIDQYKAAKVSALKCFDDPVAYTLAYNHFYQLKAQCQEAHARALAEYHTRASVKD